VLRGLPSETFGARAIDLGIQLSDSASIGTGNMTGHAVGSANSFRHSWSRAVRIWAPYAWLALLIVLIGVLGLIHNFRPRQLVESWINIHALFGLLLCCLVLARYQRCIKLSPSMLTTEIHELSRHLSRFVYLSLYLVVGLRQVISIIDSTWHGGAVDFNFFDERFRNGPDTKVFDPNNDCQLLLASGLFVLVIVRVLAFRLWLRSVERLAITTAVVQGNLNRALRD